MSRSCYGDRIGGPSRSPRAVCCPSLSACATTADHRTLRVVVTNDDGVAAPGIDILVRTLDQLPDVEVRVFAPASDRSGTGDTRVRPRPVRDRQQDHGAAIPPSPSPASRRHGALRGPPRSARERRRRGVRGQLGREPRHRSSTHSGTIGAARTAARLGLPALAVSQGAGIRPTSRPVQPSRRSGSQDHRAELLDGSAPPIVTSINVPTCPSGEFRGLMHRPRLGPTHRLDLVAARLRVATEQSSRRRRRRRCVPLRLRDPLHVRWRPASRRLTCEDAVALVGPLGARR